MRNRSARRLAKLSPLVLAATLLVSTAQAQTHNLIIFVADGLRSEIVTHETAPALAEVRDKGVDLRNSHSMFPTLTTVNAASIATGHRPGDTGDFGNVLWVGKTFDRALRLGHRPAGGRCDPRHDEHSGLPEPII